jgi:hypothetical protein
MPSWRLQQANKAAIRRFHIFSDFTAVDFKVTKSGGGVNELQLSNVLVGIESCVANYCASTIYGTGVGLRN